jgi:DNA-binding transcriptional regulator YiaG
MPNIAKVLKDEISRIARREANNAVAPARKPTAGLKRSAADLKRKVAELEKEVRSIRKIMAGIRPAVAPTTEAVAARARLTAKGVRSLRRKLRLTGQEFARLVGVTGQAVYAWEKGDGPLKVRAKTRAAILAIRSIGAREAKRRLVAMNDASKPVKATRRRTKQRKGSTPAATPEASASR